MTRKYEVVASALNVRIAPGGAIVGELRSGELVEISDAEAQSEWSKCNVLSGAIAGMSGFVRRKWLVMLLEDTTPDDSIDRSGCSEVVLSRSKEFDKALYGLGSRADSFEALKDSNRIDCSGWTYLVASDVLRLYGKKKSAIKLLSTYSDQQVTNVGYKTGAIISGRFLSYSGIVPGMLIGIDFDTYSWDRRRPLDIDHVVVTAATKKGEMFISQSSSSGGGVNVVPLERWWKSNSKLAEIGKMHAVDLLALP